MSLHALISNVRSILNGDGIQPKTVTGRQLVSLGRDVACQYGRGQLPATIRLILQGIYEIGIKGKPLDDRKFLLEHGVSFLQNLPPGSLVGKMAAEKLIEFLWFDMPHPPATHVGSGSIYRAADGSGNNVLIPGLGQSNSPYARNVPAVRPKPTTLPEPGIVFDQLLRECFQTSADNWWTNETTSYVDLSTLYGTNAAEQESVRTRNGFGTLFPDVIASKRLQMMTPAVIALLTVFSRNHNKIAARLLAFDEDNNTSTGAPPAATRPRRVLPPPVEPPTAADGYQFRTRTGRAVAAYFKSRHPVPTSVCTIAEAETPLADGGVDVLPDATREPTQQELQDEDIFQLARNINVAWFAHVVLGDYVATILNTPRANSLWSLDLGGEIIGKSGRLERGGGNAVSAEFNIAYHWHASMSEKDAEWATQAFQRMFPNRDLDTITPEEFYAVAEQAEAELDKTCPDEWTIHGLRRNVNTGLYEDDDLVKILNDAIKQPAGAFGANASPPALKVVEIMGQVRARKQNVCTMNEFRKYLGLTEYTTFEEWNSDPEVAAKARQLYRNIDDLELYPGLLAEEPKVAMPGSGTCTGHTIGRALLDDAVTLIRSDRFLTHDFNTSTLTSWGIASLRPTPGAHGGYLGALLFDAFPNSYQFNSTHALLPFYTPAAAREIFDQLGVTDQYDFALQSKGTPLKSIHTYDACKRAFADFERYGTLYNNSIKLITDNRGFFIGFDTESRHDPPSNRMLRAFHTDNFEERVKSYIAKNIEYQVKMCSLKQEDSTTRQLDIVRDVTNVVVVKWIAQRFALLIKSESRPGGLFTIEELRQMLLGCFIFSSMNVVPKAGWLLRETSLKSAAVLTELIKFRIATSTGLKHMIIDWAAKGSAVTDSEDSEQFYRALRESGADVDQLAGDALGVMIPIAGNLTQQTTLIVETYLRPEYSAALADLQRVARQPADAANDQLLLRYVLEAMRISPIVVGLPRVAKQTFEVKDGRSRGVELTEGEKVIIGTSKAHIDPSHYRNPLEIDVTRDLAEDYIHMGVGLHHCFGDRLANSVLISSVRAIFKLNNLRKDPAPTGSFKRARIDFAHGLDSWAYLDATSRESPAATTLSVLWDAETKSDPVGLAAVGDFSFDHVQ